MKMHRGKCILLKLWQREIKCQYILDKTENRIFKKKRKRQINCGAFFVVAIPYIVFKNVDLTYLLLQIRNCAY